MKRFMSKERKPSKACIGRDVQSSIYKTERKKAKHNEVLENPNRWQFDKTENQEHALNPQERYRTKNNFQISNERYLKVINPSHIRINRARIFDWLLDVCRAFELRWETYWCTIQMVDFLIFEIDCIEVNNILLFTITTLFMACKIHQSNPPFLRKLIDKAAHNTFTEGQVISLQGFILLQFANNKVKPRYLSTIYNYIYQKFPNLPPKKMTEVIRRLIMVWMDPVISLTGGKNSRDNICIGYEDIVKYILSNLESNIQNLHINEVYTTFRHKYNCENIQANWVGFSKIAQ